MKKTIIIFSAFLLVMALSFPCVALSINGKEYNYEEYMALGQDYKPAYIPDRVHFIRYEQVARLGEFQSYRKIVHSSYSYTFLDAGGRAMVLEICPVALYNPTAYEREEINKQVTIEHVADLADLQWLKSDSYGKQYLVLKTGKLEYWYNNLAHIDPSSQPTLNYIVWEHEGNKYTLAYRGGNSSIADQNTLYNRLLNYETAEKALEELLSDIDSYEAKRAFHKIGVVGLPVILVIVTIALTVTVVAVRRKKKKAADSAENEGEG